MPSTLRSFTAGWKASKRLVGGGMKNVSLQEGHRNVLVFMPLAPETLRDYVVASHHVCRRSTTWTFLVEEERREARMPLEEPLAPSL
eukprot:scaffold26889_cov131-Skeletonema_dohrnii-CCMP3373.AAC.7